MPWTLSQPPLVSDPGMQQDTCVTHVPWCMSGSLSRGGGENVFGIIGACATPNYTYLTGGPWDRVWTICYLRISPKTSFAYNLAKSYRVCEIKRTTITICNFMGRTTMILYRWHPVLFRNSVTGCILRHRIRIYTFSVLRSKIVLQWSLQSQGMITYMQLPHWTQVISWTYNS